MTPYWKKVMEGQSKGDQKGKPPGKRPGNNPKRDSSGRFQPRHGSYMVNSTSEAPEGTTAEQLWPQPSEGNTDQAVHTPAPDQTSPHDYNFIDGANERITFAWPRTGTPAIARSLVNTPDLAPDTWKKNFFGPHCKCHRCDTEGIADIMTKDELAGDTRAPGALWVTTSGWYWNCAGCGTAGTLPLGLLLPFLHTISCAS